MNRRSQYRHRSFYMCNVVDVLHRIMTAEQVLCEAVHPQRLEGRPPQAPLDCRYPPHIRTHGRMLVLTHTHRTCESDYRATHAEVDIHSTDHTTVSMIDCCIALAEVSLVGCSVVLPSALSTCPSLPARARDGYREGPAYEHRYTMHRMSDIGRAR